MKEFIEKLIERLEKQAEQYRRRGFEHEQKGYSAMADKYYGKQCSYLHSIEIVNELAKEYKGGWIPVSERLPEKDRYVLCQGVNGQFIACIDSMDDKWRDTHFYTRSTILAWMPLPAPYKEGE